MLTSISCSLCRFVYFDSYFLFVSVFSFFFFFFFFFNDTATTEIYTLSLHDALPISPGFRWEDPGMSEQTSTAAKVGNRSEEHTSELQSLAYLVCRLLLEKKKKNKKKTKN